VVLFTDGVDEGGRIGLGKVLDRARTDEVMVYSVGLEYLDPRTRMRSKPDSGLRKIAEETGGGYFQLQKSDALGATFTKVAQELHSQYTLAFTPTSLDGKTHKLTVKLKKPDLTARARRNYVAKPQ
jgi:VWFA-related protein